MKTDPNDGTARPAAQHKPVAEFWYAVQPHDAGILRFAEIYADPYAVGDIWLVQGAQRSVAADTGSGIVPAGPIVEAIAGKPVLAVALTCSYDHAGGWHSFAERACHALDAAALRDPPSHMPWILSYLSAVPRAGYGGGDYTMPGAVPTRLLEEGEVIDLGNRELQVLHTPGRSPGGLSLWEAATGSLFAGEILYDGSHGTAWPPADPPAYCASLRRLRELPVARVYPGHYGSFDGARMRALIDAQLTDLGGSGSHGP